MHDLIVTSPFGQRKVGDRIPAGSEADDILVGHHHRHVVKVEAEVDAKPDPVELEEDAEADADAHDERLKTA